MIRAMSGDGVREKPCPACADRARIRELEQANAKLLAENNAPLFAIATTRNQCFGHGDYGDVQSIEKTDAYHNGPFPPLFRSEEAARRYIEMDSSLKNSKGHRMLSSKVSIVELTVLC
jgi:hypothetical protein